MARRGDRARRRDQERGTGRGRVARAVVAGSRGARQGAARARRSARSVGSRDQRAAAIATAILIGDRAGIDEDTERQLQEAGTYHVIAISGGNIAIFAGLMLGDRWRGSAFAEGSPPLATLCALAALRADRGRRRVGGARVAHGRGLPLCSVDRSADRSGQRYRDHRRRPAPVIAALDRRRRLLAHLRRNHRHPRGLVADPSVGGVAAGCRRWRARGVVLGGTGARANQRDGVPACDRGRPGAQLRRAAGDDGRADRGDGAGRVRSRWPRLRCRRTRACGHGSGGSAHSQRDVARIRAVAHVACSVPVGRSRRGLLPVTRCRDLDAGPARGQSRRGSRARPGAAAISADESGHRRRGCAVGLDRLRAADVAPRAESRHAQPDDVRRRSGRRDARDVSQRPPVGRGYRRRPPARSTSATVCSDRRSGHGPSGASTTSR